MHVNIFFPISNFHVGIAQNYALIWLNKTFNRLCHIIFFEEIQKQQTDCDLKRNTSSYKQKTNYRTL